MHQIWYWFNYVFWYRCDEWSIAVSACLVDWDCGFGDTCDPVEWRTTKEGKQLAAERNGDNPHGFA